MADIPCEIQCITCEPPPPGALGLGLAPQDPNNPFANLSSEAPDFDLFIRRRYGGQLPPLGSTWYAVGCVSWCVSNVSADDAEVCAQNQEVLCQAVNWPMPGPEGPNGRRGTKPRDVFTNDQQACVYTCPDGNQFPFTVNAGFFIAFSKDEANTKAENYACQKATRNHICIGDVKNAASCVAGLMVATVSAQTNKDFLPILMTAEPLPAGTFLVQSSTNQWKITGYPSVAGFYPITITATGSIENSIKKTAELRVFGITNLSELPDAIIDEGYYYQLQTAGTTSEVSFSLAGGAFPDGITMDSNGLISGTPAVEGAFQVTICAEEI